MRPPVPTWPAIKRLGHQAARVVTVLAIAAAIYGLAWGIDNAHAARELAQASANLSQQNLDSQNNHHAATVKSNAKQTALLKQTAAQNATIIAQNKLIAAQQVAILNDHADTQQTLGVITTLEQQFNAAIKAGVPALEGGQTALLNKLSVGFAWVECAVANGAAACGAAPST